MLWVSRGLAATCSIVASRLYHRDLPSDDFDPFLELRQKYEWEHYQSQYAHQQELARQEQHWRDYCQQMLEYYETQKSGLKGQQQERELLLNAQQEDLLIERLGIQEAKDAIERERDLLYQSLEQERVEFQQEKLEYEEATNRRLEELEQHLEEQRLAILQEAEELFQARAAEWQAEIEQRDKQIADWMNRYYAQNGIKIPSVKHGFPGHVARLVQQVLEEFHSDTTPLLCDFEDCHQYPDGTIEVWLRPRHGVKVKSIKERLDDIRMKVGGGEPDLTVEDEVIRLAFSIDKAIASAPSAKTKDGKRVVFTEPPFEQFKYDLLNSNHYGIFGGTGCGKSTLLNNIIGLMRSVFGDELEIVIIDPKFPDTDWKIEGQEIIPQFYGFRHEDEDRDNDSFAGVMAMATDVRQRLDDATQAKLNHRKLPDRKPILYVIDEAEELIAHYGKEASDAILSTLRVGRSTRVVCVLLGQSPNCSAYGMQKPNMLNMARFWLSDVALKGMDDCNLPREKRVSIKEETLARQELAEQQRLEAIAAGDYESAKHPPAKFFTLVKPQGLPAYLATMPGVNAFADLPVGGMALADVQPPEMGIDDLIEAAKEDVPDEIRAQLNRIHNLSDGETIAALPEHQRIIVELARQRQDWIRISDLRSNRRAFRGKDENQAYEISDMQILQWFAELAAQELGELDAERQRFKSL